MTNRKDINTGDTESPKIDDNVHLLVLIHGLWGSPQHLDAARQEVMRVHAGYARCHTDASRLHVIVPAANRGSLTYDGMDVCAARTMMEVKQEIQKLEGAGSKVREFSVMGYSLGGCLLYASEHGFFQHHRPVSFSTLATPHLGILKYKNRFWQWVAVKYGHRLLGRSGDQLYYKDQFDNEGGDTDKQGRERDQRPLLEVMADPVGIFIKAINKFESIAIFANAVQDTTVPYPTGAIDSDDHFVYDPNDKTRDNVVIETDSDHLITRWYTVPQEPDQQCPPPNYRELYNVEKNIPINVPINAAHENFVLRVEAMTDTPTAPSCQTPWISPYLPPEDKRDSQTIALGASPKCASFRLDDRHFAVSMMRIILANKTKRASPSVLPPFLRFKRPFNWLFYASLPMFMPIFMVLVVAVFHWDSFISRRRVRLLGQLKTALLDGMSSATQSSALKVLAVAELTRLIRSAESSVSQGKQAGDALMDLGTRAIGVNVGEEAMGGSQSHNDGEVERARPPCSPAPSLGRRSDSISTLSRIDMALDTASTSSSGSSALRNLKHDGQYLSGVAPGAADNNGNPPLPSPRDSKLQMTPIQLRGAEMLNRGLDPRKTRKYLTWFPSVPNAHAAIVVRDGPLFPEQEIGRGVLRRWANLTVAT